MDDRFDALRTIAHDRERHGILWDLAEALVQHDQAWALWRARHVLMAERQIGTKTGTGGVRRRRLSLARRTALLPRALATP